MRLGLSLYRRSTKSPHHLGAQILWLLVVMLLFVSAGVVHAADKIGVLATVIGKVEIVRGADTLEAKQGDAVHQDDKIITGGKVELRFSC